MYIALSFKIKNFNVVAKNNINHKNYKEKGEGGNFHIDNITLKNITFLIKFTIRNSVIYMSTQLRHKILILTVINNGIET